MTIIFDGTNGITFPAGGLANPSGNLVSTGGNLVLQTADTMVMQTDGTTAVTIGSDQSVSMTSNLAVSSNLSVSGNIAGDYILGNGSQLTGLPEGYTDANVAAYLPTYTGNLVSLTGNVTTTSTVSAATLTGTLSTAAQPNVTSVGTLSSLNVTSNVNIGSTTNYGGLLSVDRAQTSSVADLLTLRDASAGTTFNLQTFSDPGVGTVNRFNYDGAYLAIRRSGTEQMRIDSAGRVTMPLQPAFIAFSNTNVEPSALTLVAYTGVTLNRGNYYNTSNSRFTAPIAGLYQFHVRTWVRPSGGVTLMTLNVNGSAVREVRLSLPATSDYSTLTPIFMINLNVNDFVTVSLGGSGSHSSTSIYYSEFSGYLVG